MGTAKEHLKFANGLVDFGTVDDVNTFIIEIQAQRAVL